MVSDKTLSFLRASKDSFKLIIGDQSSSLLITKDIYFHKDIKDDELQMFIAKAFTTKTDDAKENSIILMNKNTVCYMNNSKYFLVPGKLEDVHTDYRTGQVKVWFKYPESCRNASDKDFIKF